jgi:DNA-binding NarL/FixJ family response regulator
LISVVIADDHKMVRQGLRAFLTTTTDIEVVGEASDGPAALLAVSRYAPEIALIDVSMPGMSGVEVTQAITINHPDTAVLVLSMHDDTTVVAEALQAGARGYVLKESDGEDLLRAIRCIAAGGNRVFGPGIPDPATIASDEDPEPLTLREREVVALVASGMTSKEIAQILGIGIRTIETHRANIMRKLHLRTVAELALYAVHRGLLRQR